MDEDLKGLISWSIWLGLTTFIVIFSCAASILLSLWIFGVI